MARPPAARAAAGLVAADQATPFARLAFCRVWAESLGLHWEALGGDGELGVVFARSRRLGLRHYLLAPRGLYWGAGGLEPTAALPLIDRAAVHCRGARTVCLSWNFRHDGQTQLARAVAALGPSGCTIRESQTHVLPIAGLTLEEILARQVKGVTRRQAGHARAADVEVRRVKTAEEFAQHDAIYRAWAASRDIQPYPACLFARLAGELDPSAQLLGAFHDDRLIGAILVFHDREEWFYWHAVRDPERDRYFAIDALLAHAVDLACRAGARWFNLGASNSIRSLEFFKERWGARAQPVWSLTWAGRVWPRLLAGWRRLQTAEAADAEDESAGRASGLPD
jgi:hypothetical protein